MAKRIIILERVNPTNWQACFWLTVPAARVSFHANPDATSAYKLASAEELGALRDGTVIERVDTVSVPQNPNLAQIAAALQARWTAMQADVDAENTYGRYGTFWDGTAWTQAGA
jgi:hypothetical protein